MHRRARAGGGRGQGGATTVEFALVALFLFVLLLGIMDFARLLYLYGAVQEVTRRAAREAVVRWVDQADAAKRLALFGQDALPGGYEVTAADITVEYLNAAGGVPSPLPADPAANVTACLAAEGAASCIASVRVSVTASYRPLMGLLPFLAIPVPASTVTMPAESLGFSFSG
ncbi:MAG: pilus assembly protein [Rhodocyclales bacterium]|nr:pilus assembly protein [Rhodocyclales bacterium]